MKNNLLDKIQSEEFERLGRRLKDKEQLEISEYLKGYNSKGELHYSELEKEGYTDRLNYLVKITIVKKDILK